MGTKKETTTLTIRVYKEDRDTWRYLWTRVKYELNWTQAELFRLMLRLAEEQLRIGGVLKEKK